MATRFDPKILMRPRWLLAILVAVVLVVTFVNLALWQLDRLEERQQTNATIELRRQEPVVPLQDLINETAGDVEEMLHRTVSVQGVYRPSDEFMSIGRIAGGVLGTLAMTPLDLDDGSVLIVVRGVVPPDTEGPPMIGYETPSGDVNLLGRVDDGEEPSRIAEEDPENGDLTSINRVDLGYIDEWVSGDVLAFDLILEQQMPDSGGTPVPIPTEALSEGKHLGYAIQWFAFALIVAFGVAALVYRAGTSDEAARSEL